MRKYRITLDGKTYEMEIELISENEAIAAETKPNTPAVAETRKAEPAAPAVKTVTQDKQTTGKGVVTSPMPGSITKIILAAGDTVTKGQTVLVLEAMKMENEITAPKNGQLVKIHVNQGDTVQGGDPLFEIED